MSTPASPPASAGPAATPVPKPAVPAPLSGDLQDTGSVRTRSWNVRGGAKVLGDVEVETAILQGIVSIRGTVRAQSFRVDGTLDTSSTVQVAGPLEVHGTAASHGSVQAGSWELNGSGKVGGELTVTAAAHWKGHLEVAGGLTAGSVEFEGTLAASGDLVAPTIVGRLKGASHVANIRASRLTLTRPGLLPPMQTGALTAVRIDGQTVHLEGVEAELVKAEHVTLGPGCHIAAVEGRLDAVHPSSHVGPESRSRRPYGLSR